MKNYTSIVFFCILIFSTSSFSVRSENPVVIAKQLVFPVTGSSAKVGSVFGDERDGGRRKHEGIDIFAGKGTPLVAVSEGVVTVVRTDEIGGNNITLQPDEYTWNAYYAHLDKMYVQQGQWVSKGQLIGTVGNTGNAQTTTPHLHFGIYTSGGAIDPLPYVKTSPVISQPLPAKQQSTAKTSNTKRKQTTTNSRKSTGNSAVGTIFKNTAVQVITGILQRKIRIGQ